MIIDLGRSVAADGIRESFASPRCAARSTLEKQNRSLKGLGNVQRNCGTKYNPFISASKQMIKYMLLANSHN